MATILAFTKADTPTRCGPRLVSELIVFPRTNIRALRQVSSQPDQAGPNDPGKSTLDHEP